MLVACLRRSGAGRRQTGFTYLGLMILVAILALATSGTLTLGSIVQRRDAEQRLLEVGGSYRQAIASYLNSSPAGDRRYPAALTDLLRDPRDPGVRRHLRQLYPDPITGSREWGLVAAPGGGIMGVHSRSKGQPIKIAEFDPENASFEGAASYSDWLFVATSAPAGQGLAPGQGDNAPPPMLPQFPGGEVQPNAPALSLPKPVPTTHPGAPLR
ncbi:MAG: type II secretion system protein [Candidatus Accumulibacter sp.]|uniref:type II secretion system protein n=1 Tax=Accumulibacter sp. TaxID=2053492 RepID=UPI0025DBB9E2|nr:type II secretion system protein [Accumulibacter sp.]MCP5247558.1 type II secretion system protein [Accumulibacter sp.]